jgi:hypothetical protein
MGRERVPECIEKGDTIELFEKNALEPLAYFDIYTRGK